MSRVWVLTNEYEPFIIGGLGTAATHLSNTLARTGLQVTIITRNPQNKIAVSSKGTITVIRFPAKFPAAKIAAYMQKNNIQRPRIIHIHSLEYADLANLYRKKWNIPYVYTLHSIVRSNVSKIHRQSIQKKLLKSAKTVVVPSTQEYKRLINIYPFCKRKTKVIAHGVKLRKSSKRVRSDQLLFAGRLIREKGILELIDAMKLLKRVRPSVKLFIIGDGDPRYIRKLKLRVKKHKLQQHIYWLGFYKQSALLSAYQRYGAVVMPSKTESFGLVALEALANGIPLVSTRAGGLSMFVNSKVAQVIPRVKAEAIAKAIQAMWNHPKRTDQRVLAGKKLAANYTWTKAAKRYVKIFKL